MSTPLYEIFRSAKELQGKIDFLLNGNLGSDSEVTEEQRMEIYRMGGEVDTIVCWLQNTFGFGQAKKGGDK